MDYVPALPKTSSSNKIQSMTSLPLLERNLIKIFSAMEMVLWEKMLDVFILKVDTTSMNITLMTLSEIMSRTIMLALVLMVGVMTSWELMTESIGHQ